MMRSVSGVVKAMWHEICGWMIFFVRKLKGVGSASPFCSSKASQRIVRPSSRGGVPVFKRHSPQAQRPQRLAQQNRGRLAAAPGWIFFFAAVNQPVQKRPGSDDGGSRQQPAPIAQLQP